MHPKFIVDTYTLLLDMFIDTHLQFLTRFKLDSEFIYS